MEVKNLLQIGRDNKLLLRQVQNTQNKLELITDLGSVTLFLILASAVIIIFILYYTLHKNRKQFMDKIYRSENA